MTSYATIAQLKMQIDKQGSTGPADPANLQLLLDTATDMINGLCNRKDGFVAPAIANTRLFNGSGGPYQWIDECAAVTLVEVKQSPTDTTYTVWAAANWMPFTGDPNDPDFNHTPYQALMVMPNQTYSHFTSGKFTQREGFEPDFLVSRGTPTVRVTANWGYALVCPPRVQEACIIQAARWFKRGESSWADSMVPAESGTLTFVKELDPDVKAMLYAARLVKPTIGRR